MSNERWENERHGKNKRLVSSTSFDVVVIRRQNETKEKGNKRDDS